MQSRLGRPLAAVGASIIWLPFAMLAGVFILLFLSGLGLSAGDAPIAILSFAIVVTLPVLTWRALRTTGVAAVATLALVGIVIPVILDSLLRPDYSAPVYWIAWTTIIGGGATAVGSLLMIVWPAPGQEPPTETG